MDGWSNEEAQEKLMPLSYRDNPKRRWWDLMTKRPWVYGVVIGVVFGTFYGTLIVRGSLTTRVALGTAMGVLWGATQGAADSYHKTRRAEEADRRARVASFPPPTDWVPYQMRPTPPARYKTVEVTRSLAVLGALVGAANAVALLSPEGGFTLGGVTVTAPSIDHNGWAIVGAMAVGLLIASAATLSADRRLTRATLPQSPADATERHPTRLLVVFGIVGVSIASLQWLGVVPALGALIMITIGFAAAVAGPPVALATSRFERRTGQTVLSASPASRTLGLEVRLIRP